jgi:hypothetical protein
VDRRSAGLALLALWLGGSCVSPTRDFAAYEDKAADTAASALSQARTAILVAHIAGQGSLFAPNVSVQLQEAEIGAATSRDVFASIQPPDEASDEVRAELMPLLMSAADQISHMRIAARRRDVDEVVHLSIPLSHIADELESFDERHG